MKDLKRKLQEEKKRLLSSYHLPTSPSPSYSNSELLNLFTIGRSRGWKLLCSVKSSHDTTSIIQEFSMLLMVYKQLDGQAECLEDSVLE